MSIELLQGDCLIESKKIKNGSVDLILTDLPYGTMQGIADGDTSWSQTNAEWDSAIPPSDIYAVANRVLRKNGKVVLFSQEPYTSRLINDAIPNVPFSYRMIWEKDIYGNALFAKKAPLIFFEDILVFSKTHDYIDAESNPLRALLAVYTEEFGKENIIKLFEDEGRYSSKQSARTHASYKMGFSKGNRFDLMDEGLYEYLNEFIKFNESYSEMCFLYFRKNPLRKYFAKVLGFIGETRSKIIETIGQRADHTFRTNSSKYALCAESTYDALVLEYGIDRMDGFLPYKELKEIDAQMKKENFSSTFNLPEGKKYKSNILKYKKDYDGYHPTQKPVALLEDLIKTFSNEGDLVVDLTMGSGSTGVACKNTGRNFVGIELDDNYFEIAKRRISDARNKHEQIQSY